jgi:RNA polymerase sigma factor (TIGR02999 family)
MEIASARATQVTRLLVAATGGDREALDRLMPLVYDELRRVASRHLGRDRAGHTLQTTALVNEAYLRLIDQRQVAWENRAQFFGLASRMMRYILVDYARRRGYRKRGGGAVHVTFDETLAPPSTDPTEALLLLDEALTRLEQMDARKGRVVELRLFSGLSVEETATMLSVSQVTVMRDWRLARAWLQRELRAS